MVRVRDNVRVKLRLGLELGLGFWVRVGLGLGFLSVASCGSEVPLALSYFHGTEAGKCATLTLTLRPNPNPSRLTLTIFEKDYTAHKFCILQPRFEEVSHSVS